MKTIKKAIIPAAGLGTRFLPATKGIPKELFPIVDKPVLLHVVEEAVDAGLEEIVLITGKNKTSLEDFFSPSSELEEHLKHAKKSELLEKMVYIKNLITLTTVQQQDALGLGHAVLCAQSVVGKEPFALMLGDEIAHFKKSLNPISKLMKSFENTKTSCSAVISVPQSESSKYGMVSLAEPSKPVGMSAFAINGVIEKPQPEKTPSPWALPGRYVFTSEIFEYLKDLATDQNKEIPLSTAMDALAKEQRLLALHIPYRRFDAGDKLGYLKANVEFALEHPEVSEPFKNYLMEITHSL